MGLNLALAERAVVLRRLTPNVVELFSGADGVRAYVEMCLVVPEHKHLVKPIGLVCDGDSDLGLLTPTMPHTLSSLLDQPSSPITTKLRRGYQTVALSIAEALAHLHSYGVAHLMLHPNNILLDDKLRVQLVDFGCPLNFIAHAMEADDMAEYDRLRGDVAILYAAPEVLQHGPENLRPAADVWALGCLVTRLVSAKALYEPALNAPENDGSPHDRLDAVCNLVLKGEVHPADQLDQADLPRAIGSFVRKCAVVDPEERPTADEVVSMLQRMTTTKDFTVPSCMTTRAVKFAESGMASGGASTQRDNRKSMYRLSAILPSSSGAATDRAQTRRRSHLADLDMQSTDGAAATSRTRLKSSKSSGHMSHRPRLSDGDISEMSAANSIRRAAAVGATTERAPSSRAQRLRDTLANKRKSRYSAEETQLPTAHGLPAPSNRASVAPGTKVFDVHSSPYVTRSSIAEGDEEAVYLTLSAAPQDATPTTGPITSMQRASTVEGDEEPVFMPLNMQLSAPQDATLPTGPITRMQRASTVEGNEEPVYMALTVPEEPVYMPLSVAVDVAPAAPEVAAAPPVPAPPPKPSRFCSSLGAAISAKGKDNSVSDDDSKDSAGDSDESEDNTARKGKSASKVARQRGRPNKQPHQQL